MKRCFEKLGVPTCTGAVILTATVPWVALDPLSLSVYLLLEDEVPVAERQAPSALTILALSLWLFCRRVIVLVGPHFGCALASLVPGLRHEWSGPKILSLTSGTRTRERVKQGLEGYNCHYCINSYRSGTRHTPLALGPLEPPYCPALVSSPLSRDADSTESTGYRPGNN